LEDAVVEKHEHVLDSAPAVRNASQKLNLAASSVVRSSTAYARARLQMAFDLRIAAEALRLLAHILHGQIRRVAIQAENGIPAVSPPATESSCSKPTSLKMTFSAISIKARRARGKEISLRQSI